MRGGGRGGGYGSDSIGDRGSGVGSGSGGRLGNIFDHDSRGVGGGGGKGGDNSTNGSGERKGHWFGRFLFDQLAAIKSGLLVSSVVLGLFSSFKLICLLNKVRF